MLIGQNIVDRQFFGYNVSEYRNQKKQKKITDR